MRILICNERFLFRFGLDRVLLILAQGMAAQGHEVTLMGHSCDQAVVQPFIQSFIEIPAAPDDYLNFDDFTAAWVRDNWHRLFPPAEQPDIVLFAGWPFFQSVDLFLANCPVVVFQDHGAVPLDGFEGHGLKIQQRVRELRRQALPKVTEVVAVSDFIATSQSIPDRGTSTGVKSILNGANHLELPLWQNHLLLQQSTQTATAKQRAEVQDLLASGRPCILNLGRWEPDCYKNSQVWFDLMPRLRHRCPDVTLLVLGQPDQVQIPRSLRSCIRAVGCPDDAVMRQLMQQVTLGVSVSRWEGFNLPLAEMQWLNKPALAFDLGAHPEVVVHPWFLCTSSEELLDKIESVLQERVPEAAIAPQNYDHFRDNFAWSSVLLEYEQYFNGLMASNAASKQEIVPANLSLSSRDSFDMLIIDVTNSARDPANSGVVRVTRQLCRALQSNLEPVFVTWDFEQNQYRLPSGVGYHHLNQFNGPRLPSYSLTADPDSGLSLANFLRLEPAVQGKQPLFLFSEVLLDARAPDGLNYVLSQGWRTAAILYDLIPIFNPEFCSKDEICDPFVPYLDCLRQIDTIVAISDFSADCLRRYWNEQGVTPTGQLTSVLLPGEFEQQVSAAMTEKQTNLDEPAHIGSQHPRPIQMLCVSTLEPRKNHHALLQACHRLAKDYPALDWELKLVGNRYAGAPEVHQAVEQASRRDRRIQWLGSVKKEKIVTDAELHQLYEQADFTIYASLVEGFGMPILESVWHGTPCVCHHQGVMAELAVGGGCQTVDMTQPNALAQVLATLIQDKNLRQQLATQAQSRQLTTWQDYSQSVARALNLKLDEAPSMQTTDLPPSSAAKVWLEQLGRTPEWHELLYPKCLMGNWQMQDSEKMALTALLARHQPGCSIEIGTYHGGSLSLISQYSGAVFSIDIDPEVPGRLPPMENVSYFTGDSRQLLPMLFEALREDDLAVDFVLIDGDHSAEGVRRDLNLVLAYEPQKPLFVMMHDSFNPECRRGILEADWAQSPYVSWVEVDFIPGRMIEGEDNPFEGELWGGLALGLMVPEKRQGDLRIGQAAQGLYDLAYEAYRKRQKVTA